MENVDKRIARNTAIVLDCLSDMADLIDVKEHEYSKDETADQIRQIDTAVQYLKQATLLRRLDGMNLTQPPEKIMDGTPRPVVCAETGKVYGSIKEAAEETGVNPGNISQAVRGIIRSAGGFHWIAYIEERPEPINRKFQQAVICVETGEIFPSIKTAAEALGVNSTSISAVLRGKMNKAGGYHWERYSEPESEPKQMPKREPGVLKLQKRKTNAKPVMCVETGVVYESAAAAEAETGIKRSLISQCVNGKSKTAGGYKWERVDAEDQLTQATITQHNK